MRFVAFCLFLVTFAITVWVIRVPAQTDDAQTPIVPPAPVGDQTQPIGVETTQTLEAGTSMPARDLRAKRHFEFPEGCDALAIRTDGPGFPGGTKVDVLLIPSGWFWSGQAEIVLSGVYVVPTSTIMVLDENTGAIIVQETTVTLAVTLEQSKKLAAADLRGRFRVVPAK
jgi:hypothetical protein